MSDGSSQQSGTGRQGPGPQAGGMFAAFDAQETPIVNPEPGHVLGNYRLKGQLGEGSMATVFAVEHVQTGQRAAMKVLRAELCHNLDAMRRFDKEAVVSQRTHHPHIVEISDVLHIDGYPPALVMELLHGESLHEGLTHHGPFAAGQAMEAARQICDALSAVHRLNIVHRDLKPENVFLIGGADEPHPMVKLLDFGVVKFLYGGDPFIHTRPDATIGTPAFMAPEQLQSPEVDTRADLYAVGAILYEALTGRPPFVTNSFSEQLKKVLNEDPAPPSTLIPEAHRASYPAKLDELVLRCLARDPGDRIQTAGEMIALFDALLHGRNDVRLPPTRHQREAAAGGSWGLAIGLLVVMGLATMGFMGWLMFGRG